MNVLEVQALQAGYGKKTIVHDAAIEVGEGQIVGLLGPNGCGKSTLIKAVCEGISYEGKACICGQDTKQLSEKELARLCSYVPQKSGLAIDISVLEVVLMGFYPYLGLLEKPSNRMKEEAREMLGCVGLAKAMDSNYMELSEGQKRLCILARGLVAGARLLIMDEPDASLDFGIKNHMMKIIKERVAGNETGALITLHDTDLALTNCDVIYLMKEGRIQCKICPKEEALPDMEKKLSEIYGRVKILEYISEAGERKLIMMQA